MLLDAPQRARNLDSEAMTMRSHQEFSNRVRGPCRSSGRFGQPAVLLLIATVLAISACERDGAASRATAREHELVVFAAASLRPAFTAIGQAFERAHPGVRLEFNFAGTQELRRELEHGAEADVFASADQRHMHALVESSRVTGPVAAFARNELALAVSRESAAKTPSFAALKFADRIIVGAPEVPIGHYTLEVLERAARLLGADFRARVEAHVVSRELNVRQVYSKVLLGEADVGVVYRTDIGRADPAVRLVPIPPEFNVVADYPIAVVARAKHPVLAKEWIVTVLSGDGRRILRDSGFLVPGAEPISRDSQP